jgi:hypothetical protein
MLRHRIISALLSLGMMLSPAFCYANAALTPETGYFATPVSMRGQFIFITKVSRRQLRNSIAELRQPIEKPILVRANI